MDYLSGGSGGDDHHHHRHNGLAHYEDEDEDGGAGVFAMMPFLAPPLPLVTFSTRSPKETHIHAHTHTEIATAGRRHPLDSRLQSELRKEEEGQELNGDGDGDNMVRSGIVADGRWSVETKEEEVPINGAGNHRARGDSTIAAGLRPLETAKEEENGENVLINKANDVHDRDHGQVVESSHVDGLGGYEIDVDGGRAAQHHHLIEPTENADDDDETHSPSLGGSATQTGGTSTNIQSHSHDNAPDDALQAVINTFWRSPFVQEKFLASSSQTEIERTQHLAGSNDTQIGGGGGGGGAAAASVPLGHGERGQRGGQPPILPSPQKHDHHQLTIMDLGAIWWKLYLAQQIWQQLSGQRLVRMYLNDDDDHDSGSDGEGQGEHFWIQGLPPAANGWSTFTPTNIKEWNEICNAALDRRWDAPDRDWWVMMRLE